jgi:transcription initiation factor TFIIIB Brf1 subunit/transcription initiation factor TFIIB
MYNYGPSDLEASGCFCETPIIIFDSATSTEICAGCGVVMEMVLDESPEYGYDDNGADVSYTSSFSGTTVQFSDNKLANKLQVTAMTNADVKAQEMKRTVDTICSAYHIQTPHIIRDMAMELATKLDECVRICGKKRFASYAAAVYFSCKLNNAYRELRSFSEVCGVDIKNLNFAVKMFKEHLNEYISPKNSPHDTLVSSTILKFNIDEESKKLLRKVVLNMIDAHSDIFDSGRKPRTIVAALLLINVFCHNIQLDVRDIAESMGICHTSIATCAREISKVYGIQF